MSKIVMIFLSILIFILAMSLPFFKNQITPILFTRITALVFIYAGVLTFNALHIQSIGSGIGIYSGFYQVTYFSLFIETFLYMVGAIILLSWPLVKYEGRNQSSPSRTLITDPTNIKNFTLKNIIGKTNVTELTIINTSPESKEYSLIALFSTLGGSLLLSSGDLLSMYLSIELQSFGLYILATIYRDSGSATGAGLKYFLLGGLSSCLILLGASLIYSFTGLTNFESIYSLVSVISINNSFLAGDINTDLGNILINQTHSMIISPLMVNVSQGLLLGLVLIIVGFLFKIAGAPFHNWAPDVYDESPTNITIWLTIMPKISIVIFLLELEIGIASQISQSIILSNDFFTTNYGTLSNTFNMTVGLIGSTFIIKNIFLLSSFLSLIIGTVVGLAQTKIKRLLAYSTISHVGFLLLALAINTEQSTESLILYLIQYIITSLNTFFILLAFGYIINSSLSSVRTSVDYEIKSSGNISSDSIQTVPIHQITSLSAPLRVPEGREGLGVVDGVLPQLVSFVNKTREKKLFEGVKNKNSDIRFIFDLKGQFISNSILSLSLAICLFSMAGIPPLIGFFGKQSVLYAAIGNGYFFMALLAIIVSVISAFYYLRIVRELHSDSGNVENVVIKENMFNIASENSKITQPSLILTNIHSFIIATLTLSILFFVLKPSILLNSIVLLSLSLFNG